jgi:hypothetical protein
MTDAQSNETVANTCLAILNVAAGTANVTKGYTGKAR